MTLDRMIRQIVREELDRFNKSDASRVTPALIRHQAKFERPHELAKATGIPIETIRRYEAGRWCRDREETRANWRRIAEVCSVPYEAYREACFNVKAG